MEFKEITEDTLFAKRKERKNKQLSVSSMPRKPWKPEDNHPWKRLNRSLYKNIDK